VVEAWLGVALAEDAALIGNVLAPVPAIELVHGELLDKLP